MWNRLKHTTVAFELYYCPELKTVSDEHILILKTSSKLIHPPRSFSIKLTPPPQDTQEKVEIHTEDFFEGNS
jgi:hypothetical protein